MQMSTLGAVGFSHPSLPDICKSDQLSLILGTPGVPSSERLWSTEHHLPCQCADPEVLTFPKVPICGVPQASWEIWLLSLSLPSYVMGLAPLQLNEESSSPFPISEAPGLV